MLDFHPAGIVGSLVGGDPYEVSPVDAEPDMTLPIPERSAASPGSCAAGVSAPPGPAPQSAPSS